MQLTNSIVKTIEKGKIEKGYLLPSINDLSIDFYIYNNDFALFRKLLTNKRDGYSHCVIIPHFLEGGEKAH